LTGRTSLIDLAETPRSVQDSIFIIFIIVVSTLALEPASNPDQRFSMLVDGVKVQGVRGASEKIGHRKLVTENQAEPQRIGQLASVFRLSRLSLWKVRNSERVSGVFQVLLRTGTG